MHQTFMHFTASIVALPSGESVTLMFLSMYEFICIPTVNLTSVVCILPQRSIL